MRTGRGVLMCWFVVTACANEDVVLFDFRGGGGAGASGMPSASGTGGPANGGSAASIDVSTAGAADMGAGDVTGAPSPPPSCQSNGDCPYGWSCEKLNCTDVTGSCIARPVCSDQTLDLVCGCDGVTYWNDCLRKRAGQESSTKGQCEIAKICRSAADCGGTSSVCGRLFPADACNEGMFGQHGPGPDPQGNQPPPGTCWSIPQNCGAATDTFGWIECGAAAPMTCLDTCEALSTGRFFVASSTGTCP